MEPLKEALISFKLCLLLIVIFLISCSVSPQTVDENKEDIREAVFRYQLNGPFPRRPDIFCLEAENQQDPSDKLMQRFATHVHSVKKGSECEVRNDLGGEVKDITMSKRAIILTVDSIHFKLWKKVEVEGGWYMGERSASFYLYTLRKEGPHWIVKSSKVLAVS